MIICHTHKFIYLKTPKTAGTSIEVFFEQFCEEGDIIGMRGKENIQKFKPEWNNHMSAKKVCDKLDPDVWNSYFKFCSIRNPWDLMVSRYWYKRGMGLLESDFDTWICTEESCRNNFPRFHSIDGAFAMDFCIRYERLHEDIQHICSVLGLPCDLSTLPTLKSTFRKSPDHYSQYYTKESREWVQEKFSDEIERFNYAFETQEETSDILAAQ